MMLSQLWLSTCGQLAPIWPPNQKILMNSDNVHLTLLNGGRGPACPESDRKLACQPLAIIQKVDKSEFTCPEADYSQTPSSLLRGRTIAPLYCQAGRPLKPTEAHWPDTTDKSRITKRTNPSDARGIEWMYFYWLHEIMLIFFVCESKKKRIYLLVVTLNVSCFLRVSTKK